MKIAVVILLAAALVIIGTVETIGQGINYVGSTLWTQALDIEIVDNNAFCVYHDGLFIFDISMEAHSRTISRRSDNGQLATEQVTPLAHGTQSEAAAPHPGEVEPNAVVDDFQIHRLRGTFNHNQHVAGLCMFERIVQGFNRNPKEVFIPLPRAIIHRTFLNDMHFDTGTALDGR